MEYVWLCEIEDDWNASRVISAVKNSEKAAQQWSDKRKAKYILDGWSVVLDDEFELHVKRGDQSVYLTRCRLTVTGEQEN